MVACAGSRPTSAAMELPVHSMPNGKNAGRAGHDDGNFAASLPIPTPVGSQGSSTSLRRVPASADARSSSRAPSAAGPQSRRIGTATPTVGGSCASRAMARSARMGLLALPEGQPASSLTLSPGGGPRLLVLGRHRSRSFRASEPCGSKSHPCWQLHHQWNMRRDGPTTPFASSAVTNGTVP